MTGDGNGGEAGDARFEDAPLSDRPLRLLAEGTEDLAVISALVQDAVARASEVMFLPRKRRVVVLMNRFRWEDAEAARRAGREFERVRTALQIDDVTGMQARGIGRPDRETVLALLAIGFEPAAEGDADHADGTREAAGGADDATADADDADGSSARAVPAVPGDVVLTCAGDVAFRVAVECLSVTLADLTRPWAAAAGLPEHPLD